MYSWIILIDHYRSVMICIWYYHVLSVHICTLSITIYHVRGQVDALCQQVQRAHPFPLQRLPRPSLVPWWLAAWAVSAAAGRRRCSDERRRWISWSRPPVRMAASPCSSDMTCVDLGQVISSWEVGSWLDYIYCKHDQIRGLFFIQHFPHRMFEGQFTTIWSCLQILTVHLSA